MTHLKLGYQCQPTSYDQVRAPCGWGGCQISVVEVIHLVVRSEASSEEWEAAIYDASEGDVLALSSRSRDGEGRVGDGWS